jgi:hypothetical protein
VAKLFLRIGLFMMVIGLCIFFSNVATQGVHSSTTSGPFSTGPNGSSAELFVPLLSGSKEIRINVERSFEGTLYIFDYEGARRLVDDGVSEPIVREDFRGSTLIDFNLSRRNAYMIVIESHVDEAVEGTFGIVQKGGTKMDMLADSALIAAIGAVIAVAGAISSLTQQRKPK